jgi:hypothetical protein
MACHRIRWVELKCDLPERCHECDASSHCVTIMAAAVVVARAMQESRTIIGVSIVCGDAAVRIFV